MFLVKTSTFLFYIRPNINNKPDYSQKKLKYRPRKAQQNKILNLVLIILQLKVKQLHYNIV